MNATTFKVYKHAVNEMNHYMFKGFDLEDTLTNINSVSFIKYGNNIFQGLYSDVIQQNSDEYDKEYFALVATPGIATSIDWEAIALKYEVYKSIWAYWMSKGKGDNLEQWHNDSNSHW